MIIERPKNSNASWKVASIHGLCEVMSGSDKGGTRPSGKQAMDNPVIQALLLGSAGNDAVVDDPDFSQDRDYLRRVTLHHMAKNGESCDPPKWAKDVAYLILTAGKLLRDNAGPGAS
jgi:hypothetical protein